NPRYAGQEILGEKVYASLSEIPFPVDIVDVFRKSEECPALAEEAVKIGARVFWIQLGIENDEAGRIARDGGLQFVQNRCVKIEHARFHGGMNLVGLNTGVITGRRALR
ncbi:MAG: CoA-binding protein, partial [Chloroflexota bacterium]|nr:CoA-binding protein [Chloroflexota bacterium]